MHTLRCKTSQIDLWKSGFYDQILDNFGISVGNPDAAVQT